MAYKVVWSPEASNTFDNIVDYLKKTFSENEAAWFVQLVNRRLLLLKKFPELGRRTSVTSGRRRTVLHKRTILYYRIYIRNREVHLLSFFDTRQNPRKRKF